jgi:alpha-galactosidase
MYREDNCTRGKLNQVWKVFDKREGEGRKGISEAKMIAAHYRLWDEILCCTLSYGGCGFLDSCAGGGGRNDIESLRRGVPLLRSDLDRTSTSIRLSMTSTLSKWIPFCGANSREKVGEHSKTGISDKYVWRASYLPALNVDAQFVMDKSPDFDNMRFGLKEWRLVSEYLLKEFYPLTVWHPRDNDTDFTAYAYYDPEKEKGILFVFRQENCVRNNIRLQLPFAKGKYILTDEDSKDTLITEGNIEIFIEEKRTAKLIRIEKITG